MNSDRPSRFSFRAGTFSLGFIFAAVFGVALFLAIADIGFARIWDEVTSVGFGLVAIVVVHIGQLALCTFGWSVLFTGLSPDRRPTVMGLFALRWIRESIDHLLPVAQVGGEIAAGRLLEQDRISLPIAGASIIADLTIETLTQALFTLIGLALIFALADPGDVGRWAGLGFGMALFLAALAVFAQRWGGVRLFEKLLLTIAERMGWNRLEGIAGLDQALARVYRLRRKLLVAGLHHMAAWSLGAGEVMIAAWALGHPLGIGQSYVIESLAQAIRSVAFFVPGALGVQEGGFVVLAALFGVPSDVALSISLTKRIRELALGLPGLAAWQLQELRLRRVRRVVEMDRKAVQNSLSSCLPAVNLRLNPVELLFDLFGFLDVVLRLVALAAQALEIGGIAFILLVVLPFRVEIGIEADGILRRCRVLLCWGAGIAVVGAITNIIINVLLLYGSADVPIADGLMANFAIAEMVRIAASLVILFLAGNQSMPRGKQVALTLLAVILLIAAAANSHSVARMTDQVPMALADALHQLGASVWIGGIPYFVITLAHTHDGIAWRRVGKRFSQMSMASVAGLVAAGLVLAYVFVGSWQGLYGTSYGVMVIGKVALLGILLGFGFMNFRLVERLRADPSTPILRMRRFAEAEIGIGLSVFALAASITSSPPSIDQPYDQVPWSVTAERMMPVLHPRLTSPKLDDTAIQVLQRKLDAEAAAGKITDPHPRAFVPGAGLPVDRIPADIAWSEYNHHWAGIMVAIIGILALLERTRIRWLAWTRHWPLMFLVLAGFLFLRSDPEDWPSGTIGFWESLKDAEPLQHKFIVLLVVVFGLFEWSVRIGVIKKPWAALVYPILTAVGGIMLLMHSHNITDVKEQFLIEMTHIPLALLAVISAWSRWLELRLDPPLNRTFGWVWPITYVLIGLLLLEYREA